MILESIFSLVLQNSDIQDQELRNLQFLRRDTLKFLFLEAGKLSLAC